MSEKLMTGFHNERCPYTGVYKRFLPHPWYKNSVGIWMNDGRIWKNGEEQKICNICNYYYSYKFPCECGFMNNITAYNKWANDVYEGLQ